VSTTCLLNIDAQTLELIRRRYTRARTCSFLSSFLSLSLLVCVCVCVCVCVSCSFVLMILVLGTFPFVGRLPVVGSTIDCCRVYRLYSHQVMASSLDMVLSMDDQSTSSVKTLRFGVVVCLRHTPKRFARFVSESHIAPRAHFVTCRLTTSLWPCGGIDHTSSIGHGQSHEDKGSNHRLE
jgi:hypothetical protein